MFKSNPQSLPTGQVDTLVGPQATLQGDLHFSGGLVVEGRIVGRVLAADGQPAMVTLTEQGSIEGEVRAPVVVVNGRLQGDVHATERVVLAPKARVEGDIHYQVVEMSAGAVLDGRLVHVPAATTGLRVVPEAGKDPHDVPAPARVATG
jgi:cytoskeletal protein CcmA (bactofilin family)